MRLWQLGGSGPTVPDSLDARRVLQRQGPPNRSPSLAFLSSAELNN